MANSAFRLVDDDFDFEDLDEIDDMDLNKLVNPEDGSMGIAPVDAGTDTVTQTEEANNAAGVGMGDTSAPLPTMSGDMEGTESFFLEPNPGFDTSMFGDSATVPATPTPAADMGMNMDGFATPQVDGGVQDGILQDGSLENLDGVLKKSLTMEIGRASCRERV